MPIFGPMSRISFRPCLGLLAVSATAMMLGACASMDGEGVSAATLVSDQVTGSTGSDRRFGSDHGTMDSLTLARKLKADGQKFQAAEVLGDALSRTPDNRELLGEQGRLLLDLGEVDKAAELLALADDPSAPDWKVVSARGTVSAKKGQFADARTFYERANALAPNEASVLNNLALVYAANGDTETAVRLLRQALAKNSDPRTQRNLDLVVSLAGRPGELQTAVWGTTVEAAPAPVATMRPPVVRATTAAQASPPQIRRMTTN